MSTGNTLHSFGCSFTFGHGLPDCLNNDKRLSKLSYVVKLAQHYDLSYINYARCGSSPLAQYNEFIFNYEHIFPGDVVTFLWPNSSRTCIYNEVNLSEIRSGENWNLSEVSLQAPEFNDTNILGPQNTYCNLTDYYDNWTSNFNSLILLATYIKTVQVMCEYKGIKCVQHILDMNDHVMLKVISNSDMPMGSCLKQYKFHKRSLDQYINDPRLRRKINKSTQLNLDYVPDGHFNEDVHKLWSYLYSRDLDNT